jgi:hypothetical protein
VVATPDRTIERYGLTLTVRVFNHYDGIRAFGNASARHNLNALSRLKRSCKTAASAEFSNALQPSARCRSVRCSQSESIPRGAIEGRIVAVRTYIARQHSAKRLFDFDVFPPQRTPEGSGDVDYFLPRISVRQ